MLRFLAAMLAAAWMVGTPVGIAAAQEWNDPRTSALVTLATARRAQQLADTGLTDYRALARGYLTFLAQVGEGFTEPPRIVKADQLALEVYWRAPNLSKQRIIGRRDTLLLPTDINYHRDHLGIIQNNFPEIIRLGDGDEVQDVPHPLSATGLGEYDFSIRDSIRIRLPDRTIEVYEVRVRPKDDRQPRAIGAVYIDREEGQVVRMAFSFTRVALKDEQLDDVSVVLENALTGGRFWLPSRQEIEIRRSGTWLDYPARGIIRGRWEISGYELNRGLPLQGFTGAEIVMAPRQVLRDYPWEGRVLDSLPPDVRAVTDAEVARVQEEARTLVRAQALSRSRRPAIAARGVSELVRVNRVEGLAVGLGVGRRIGGGVTLAGAARWGFADQEAKGRLRVSYERAGGAAADIAAYRTFREAGDVQERSTIANSFAAQEFGSDHTDPFDARGLAIGVERPLAGLRWRLDGGHEWQRALLVHARPATGRYEPTIPALERQTTFGMLTVSRPTSLAWFGTELRAELSLKVSADRPWNDETTEVAGSTLLRGALTAEVERPVGQHRFVLRTFAAAASSAAAPQDLVYYGGVLSGPGYDFHELAGRAGVSQRVEWRTPVPFVAIPLGRFGRSPAGATLAPYLHGVYIDGRPAHLGPGPEGFHPSAGVGVLALFDLLRFDVAHGLREGRFTFSVDVSRDFWGIL